MKGSSKMVFFMVKGSGRIFPMVYLTRVSLIMDTSMDLGHFEKLRESHIQGISETDFLMEREL